MTLFPVIIAGGSGSRLWPLSRESRPKQFLTLVDAELSLLQLTVQRLEGLETASPLLVCNEDHRFLAGEQMRQIGKDHIEILLEPMVRNTAPAIALAALALKAQADDPILLVLAADHFIKDVSAFHASVVAAQPLAAAGKLVTFGVAPTSPETGFGYIERGDAIGHTGFSVCRFVEKPDDLSAREYMVSGRHYWNSGMFMFRASCYLRELERFEPAILESCVNAMEEQTQDMLFTRIGAKAFASCPDKSIDYAVMERTSDAVVCPLTSDWSDVGSWSALWSVGAKNENGNIQEGDVLTESTRDCFIRADHRLVATVGVENLIIVETADAVLVAHKDEVQHVKKIVAQLGAKQRPEHRSHREVFRPWGVYDSIGNGHRYQVKRITVNPGGKLSVQMHHHRAEHWVVVSGTARVTNGEKTYLVTENQSTYIPIGQQHSLENPGVIPLELIEVQSGSYLGEDDIVRIADNYGRV